MLFTIYALANYSKIALGLVLPAALIGICLLFLLLLALSCVPKPLQLAATPLLKHMSLFFLPAIVAVVNYTDIIFAHPLALLFAIVLCTLLSLVITALIANKLMAALLHLPSASVNEQSNEKGQ